MTQERRTARPARRSPNPAAVLARVREILAETCEQDGRGSNLQESARRKAYRAGINRALRVIDDADTPQAAAARAALGD